MKHFGIITPPVAGHLNPFCAIGRELIRRGHRVTVVHMPEIEQKVRSEGLEFIPIGAADHPPGTLANTLKVIGSLSGLSAMRYTVQAAARSTEMILREAPDVLKQQRVDALLVDQTEPGGASVADRLQLPYITVCNALALNRDVAVPPPFSGFGFGNTWVHRLRNRLGYAAGKRAVRPIRSIVNSYRSAWGLKPYIGSDDSFSKIAQLSQQPPAFDFPRSRLPVNFHYLGPFRDGHTTVTEFPWERLNGKPLVYASLGSMQGSKIEVFRVFAAACEEVGVQAVISHGGALSAESAASLPGSHLVVNYAPQVQVISRAQLTLTHAGLNTVLDSLSQGVPLVAIPITYEQPAIAQRIRWCGAGRTLSMQSLTVSSLRQALSEVLASAESKKAAVAVQTSIQQAGGTTRAADIIEASVA